MTLPTSSVRVSVIIAAFNAEAFLLRAIASVLGQDEPGVEVIVVDDNSTDRTAAVVEELHDPRVRLVRLEHNLGAAGARQKGLEHAVGDLIATLDADDEWLPGALSALRQTLLSSGAVGLAYGGVMFMNEAGEVTSRYQPLPRLTFHDLLAHRLVPSQTMLMRRDVLVAAGGLDGGTRLAEDWDVCLRLAQRAQLQGHDQVLAVAHVHGSNTSSDARRVVEATMSVLKKHAKVHHSLCLICRWATLQTRYEYGRPALLGAAAAVYASRGAHDVRVLARVVMRHPDVALMGVVRRLLPGAPGACIRSGRGAN